jgi:hypothetical protein
MSAAPSAWCPAKYYQEVGQEGFVRKPIGAGPYKLVAQEPGSNSNSRPSETTTGRYTFHCRYHRSHAECWLRRCSATVVYGQALLRPSQPRAPELFVAGRRGLSQLVLWVRWSKRFASGLLTGGGAIEVSVAHTQS